MPLKQTSLFDFDSGPEDDNQPEQPPVIQEEAVALVVNEEPVEVDFTPIPLKREEPVAEVRKSTRGRRKLSEISLTADLVDVPDDEVLFQKKYYSIGIVAEMFKVNISLIRFWEKEFDILKPKLNGKGDRHFRPEDVKNLKMIHHLLREKKYTIEGAKDFLKKNKRAEENFGVIEELKKLKFFLTELKLSL
jgi:DNA-binding transcriptional MerR regulator